jgi:hypothetical protein
MSVPRFSRRVVAACSALTVAGLAGAGTASAATCTVLGGGRIDVDVHVVALDETVTVAPGAADEIIVMGWRAPGRP